MITAIHRRKDTPTSGQQENPLMAAIQRRKDTPKSSQQEENPLMAAIQRRKETSPFNSSQQENPLMVAIQRRALKKNPLKAIENTTKENTPPKMRTPPTDDSKASPSPRSKLAALLMKRAPFPPALRKTKLGGGGAGGAP